MDAGIDSDDEGMLITRDIIEHGMRTGSVNDPVLEKRLTDYIASRREKYKAAKKSESSSFTAFRDKKKISKKSKTKRPPVKGLPSESTSSEGDEGGFPPMMNLDCSNAPTTISSKVYKPYEDDTPVYVEQVEEVHISSEGETSDERDLIQRMKTLNVIVNEKEERSLLDEQLSEVKEMLDSGSIPSHYFTNPAWRSAFFATNESDILTEKILSDFLDSYAKR